MRAFIICFFLATSLLAARVALGDTPSTTTASSTPAASPPSSASIAPAASPTFATELAEAVLKIAAGVVSVILAWAVHKVASVFQEKTKIAVPQATEDMINAWAQQGVAFAEEKAHGAVEPATQKLTGPDKLKAATDFVWSLVQQHDLVNYTRDLVEAKVQAALGMSRPAVPAAPAAATA